MSTRNLEYFFHPKSVAVVGASDRPHSIGALLMRNLTDGYAGPIYPVNPKRNRVAGRAAVANIAALPTTVDLAVVCSPPETVPDVIAELGRAGTKAAIVITAGLGSAANADSLARRALEAARPNTLRILGPNCLGLLVPGIHLNASFASAQALPGSIAFVTQSGALATAVLDWSKSRGIGFSCFVSIGDAADVDIGDLLDYLGSDPNTSAILLYIESITNARKFMSAARGAARSKMVIAVKAGRVEEGARAAASHTGALAGVDDIVDAALRRAGILRVQTTRELFDAVETLARAKPVAGSRLAIMTNGGGAGVLATDALILGGGQLAALSAETVDTLNTNLPPTWSHANPIDIIGDAPTERYASTLRTLVSAKEVDSILLLHAPTAIVPSLDIAQAVAPIIKASNKNILTCWLGEDSVLTARQLFATQSIASYETPEDAVRAFLHLANFQRQQELLLETPESPTPDASIDAEAARGIIAAALEQQRTLLSEVEAKQLLAAYGIPTVVTRSVASADEATFAARAIGYPVALKILSPDITHKSDVGGVALDIEDENELRNAAAAMLQRVHNKLPHARISGFTVQPMIPIGRAQELILGCSNDPIFGPVILFGHGGVAVEVIKDRAFALPPLNTVLARDLVNRTRVAKLLRGYRDRPAVNEESLLSALIRLSQLICDHSEIEELDINPLFADEHGVLALDARVRVAPTHVLAESRLAIRPYPRRLEERIDWRGSPILVRPIRPEDEPQHAQFLHSLAAEDVYSRFFHVLRSWPHKQLARLTQIDYDREMALVATRSLSNGDFEILGVVRTATDPDNQRAEFAVIVRSEIKGQGLGYLLLDKMMRYSRERGTRKLVGLVLANNLSMLTLTHSLGFQTAPGPEQGVVEVTLDLNSHLPP